jgi:ketosteroid isomerase-like protein
VANTDIRAALERHWSVSAADDPETVEAIYHDDVVVDYPQSGERIRGTANLRGLREAYPAKLTFDVRRISGRGDLWVTEYVITYDGKPVNTVRIMEFTGDKVAHETVYFADPFEAPEWRAQWVERMDG